MTNLIQIIVVVAFFRVGFSVIVLATVIVAVLIICSVFFRCCQTQSLFPFCCRILLKQCRFVLGICLSLALWMQLSALGRKDVVIAKLFHLWITNQKVDFNGAQGSVELLLSQ